MMKKVIFFLLIISLNSTAQTIIPSEIINVSVRLTHLADNKLMVYFCDQKPHDAERYQNPINVRASPAVATKRKDTKTI